MLWKNSSKMASMKSKFVWRKKAHPKHKYSVTFVRKVGTIKMGASKVIVSTFVTKVTEYLCSRWVFFQTNFHFSTSHFWRSFVSISFQNYCCLELKLKKIFHRWSFFAKLWEKWSPVKFHLKISFNNFLFYSVLFYFYWFHIITGQ